MQKSWREDGDKLTFIACLNSCEAKDVENGERGKVCIGEKEKEKEVVQGGIDDSDDRMIGDVNLFLSEDDEEDDDNQSHANEKEGKKVIGEIEIMIATPEARGKGYGKAILLTFLWYIITNTSTILLEYSRKGNASLKFLRVKIDAENEKSINLFEKVGFTKTSPKPNYFNEIELRLSPADEASLSKDMQEPSIALYRLPAAAKEAQ